MKPSSTLRGRLGAATGGLWVVSVVVLLVAAGTLIFGPWTDETAELAGWDAERFQEIADRQVPAWSGTPVEYPPGSVVVFDAVAGSSVVGTNRALVVLAVVSTAVAALALWRGDSARAAKAFLVFGLPLTAIGLVRLDPLVTALAVVAAVAVLSERGRRPRAEAVFALAVTAGAMVKIWPVLLVAGALATRRHRAAGAAVAAGGVAGLVWLGWVGDGLEPVRQVLALRGATGWHVESVPGSIVALLGDEAPRLELNAFRIGHLSPAVVTIGRALAVGTILALVSTARRRNRPATSAESAVWTDRDRLALTMLGATAALIATAPLLSPQFLIWLTPWAALVATGEAGRAAKAAAGLTGAAVVLTGLALTLFAPPDLADPFPAVLITVRNIALLLVPVACLTALRSGPVRPTPRSDPADAGRKDSLGY